MATGISVIICCYNSSTRLEQTLKFLTKQEIDLKICWEIIIVNNASTDNTSEVAINEWNKYQIRNIDFKVIDENVAGLNYARKKGISESIYNYILLCDDDNWLHHNYIETAFRIMEHNPQIGILGGTGTPYFENGLKPDWFDKFEGYYAVGKQGITSGDVTYSRGYVFGAGMILRKRALNNIDLDNLVLTDRKGNKLSSGGDTELSYRVICNGYKIWWEDSLKFEHFISSKRLTLDYIKKYSVDTVGTNLLLHGLQYKAQVHPVMFDNVLKRMWIGRVLSSLLGLLNKVEDSPLGTKFGLYMRYKEFMFLLTLINKYNKQFN